MASKSDSFRNFKITVNEKVTNKEGQKDQYTEYNNQGEQDVVNIQMFYNNESDKYID